MLYLDVACSNQAGRINIFFFYSFTITYRVFHHDLLMAKFHHIDYKIILMAYMVKKIGFMAPRKFNYLNEW
jgi:hypothetical protein